MECCIFFRWQAPSGRALKNRPPHLPRLGRNLIALFNMPLTSQPGFLLMGCTLYVNLKISIEQITEESNCAPGPCFHTGSLPFGTSGPGGMEAASAVGGFSANCAADSVCTPEDCQTLCAVSIEINWKYGHAGHGAQCCVHLGTFCSKIFSCQKIPFLGYNIYIYIYPFIYIYIYIHRQKQVVKCLPMSSFLVLNQTQ